METSTSQIRKQRTITLTDARPVKIYEDDWDVIAQASSHNGEHESQANYLWSIRVREHADGRRLVYGVLRSGNGGVAIGWRGWAGGRLIPPTAQKAQDGTHMPDDEATIAAIKECAAGVGDDGMGDAVIADLPAQEI